MSRLEAVCLLAVLPIILYTSITMYPAKITRFLVLSISPKHPKNRLPTAEARRCPHGQQSSTSRARTLQKSLSIPFMLLL